MADRCEWCKTDPDEALARNEGPHVTWCPNYRRSSNAPKAPAGEEFPLVDLMREAEREIDLRRKHYPRWTRDGRMRQADAIHHMKLMDAIRRHFLKAAGREAIGLFEERQE